MNGQVKDIKTPNNAFKMYGILEVFVQDNDGNEIRKYKFYNDIVSYVNPTTQVPYGTAIVTSMLTGRVRQGITGLRIGTGTTATTDTTTQLTADIGLESPALPVSNTATAATIQFYTTDPELPNGTYHEFGFFVGTAMFARVVNATGVNKVSGENIVWQYTVNVSKS